MLRIYWYDIFEPNVRMAMFGSSAPFAVRFKQTYLICALAGLTSRFKPVRQSAERRVRFNDGMPSLHEPGLCSTQESS